MTLADDVVTILSKNGFGHLTIINATALETKYHMNDVRVFLELNEPYWSESDL